MDTGVKTVSEQNYAKALNCYQKMHKFDNQNEDICLFGADIYWAQDSWEEAARIIEEGIAITDFERLKNGLGHICKNVVVVSVIRTEGDREVEVEFEYDKHGNRIKDTEGHEEEIVSYIREYSRRFLVSLEIVDTERFSFFAMAYRDCFLCNMSAIITRSS